MSDQKREFNGVYEGECLNKPAFPLGGLGAGMICLEGMGALSHVSLRHKPDVLNTPCMFSALKIKGENGVAKLLEGSIADWKILFPFKATASGNMTSTGNGHNGDHFGLPRFATAKFSAQFPFGTVQLCDEEIPLAVSIEGWSPFIPQDSTNSSLPVAGLEYCFKNNTGSTIEATYSFNSVNLMKFGTANSQVVRKIANGFVFEQQATEANPEYEGYFSAQVLDEATVNPAWFRGGWFDALSIVWQDIAADNCQGKAEITTGDPSPGASLFVPLSIAPGEEKRVKLLLSWYVPVSDVRTGDVVQCCMTDSLNSDKATYKPWYAVKFDSISKISAYWKENYSDLKEKSALFRHTFYDTSLPNEVIEAVAANLTILKSPTVMRQHDGRLWCWEGCCDCAGCCAGSCTHVWNYAQALPHLFPELERSLRQTEFNENQNTAGHQAFRASIPIRPAEHDFHAASDGQLGGIMKLHREWRIKGDNDWLIEYWPKAKLSIDYCTKTWDPDRKGVLEEPHHNTYDIEFWGPDGMCSSFYLGALKAMVLMGKALAENTAEYQELFDKGRQYLETKLYNGEYFIQEIEWQNLKAENPAEAIKFTGLTKSYSPEVLELLEKEGPRYQYGNGCLADGVLGAWMAKTCGIGEILDPAKVKSHLLAVHKYNLKTDLSNHPNPQRPTYALGKEGGLLLCSWPHGDALSLPFVYSNEVWPGIEYQVASHLMMIGCAEKGLEIVREVRKRYDGRARNPFNEYECGHWYARAMSSYALLQGLTGISYDAGTATLTVKPAMKGDCTAFLSTATGYGTVEVKAGKVALDVKSGTIPVKTMVLL
ncbi:MAG: non-lysosomal glucosylceramidase [Victivallaceae bacterium]|nr:non-lysosomal glucosylceramidase [Victivallaceae bacterium]